MAFDIDALLRFHPPQYRCEKCLALFQYLFWKGINEDETPLKCPVCQVEYLPTNSFPRWKTRYYFDRFDGIYSPKLNDPYQHAKELAEIAHSMRSHQQQPNNISSYRYTPLHPLFEALSIAKKFVHFTTYGIHPLLIGALKVAAQRIWINGIVSGARGEVVSEAMLSELEDEDQESPRMKLKHYGTHNGYKEIPHQKLVIVDGLLAFKGAANLTLAGWRKAAQGRDVVEVVTNVEEIIQLNNRLFAPIWAELSEVGSTIEMRP